MRNLKLTIEYNGANFSGWQKQNGKRTVQGELETAFAKLCPNENEIVVEGSGRTDSGVHALGQVASVKIENPIPTSKCKEVLNSLLPKDIRIKKVENAKDDFHARFSAKKKTYRYLVKLGEDVSAFEGDFVAVYSYKDVDIETMKSASKVLIGKHDFQAFCSADTSVTNFEREIYDIKIEQNKKMVVFEITGNGFLYNMVRIVAGTLLDFGRKRLSANDMTKIIESKDRRLAGQTMPACGLYLKKVEYEK